MTADDKYSVLNRDNLTQPIQIQLCQKEKAFSKFVAPFLKARLNFEHLQKKYHPHCKCVSNITDFKKHG